jgi:hypothetical protein
VLAATTTHDLALDRPPAVAAEYRTTFQNADGKSPSRTVTWRFWRQHTRLASENLTEYSGIRWQRDGTALFAQILFHDQRRRVEYHPDDWGVAAVEPHWAEQGLLVDPEILIKLEARRATRDAGHPVQRFIGEIGSTRWDVSIRADLVLSVEIDKHTPDGREHTVLVETHELRLAPWQPPIALDYSVVEFANLGDEAGVRWPGSPGKVVSPP